MKDFLVTLPFQARNLPCPVSMVRKGTSMCRSVSLNHFLLTKNYMTLKKGAVQCCVSDTTYRCYCLVLNFISFESQAVHLSNGHQLLPSTNVSSSVIWIQRFMTPSPNKPKTIFGFSLFAAESFICVCFLLGLIYFWLGRAVLSVAWVYCDIVAMAA